MIRKVSTRVSCGNAQMPNAVSSPISSAARNAPGTLPRPPTTTTTKASTMIRRSMSWDTASRGSCKAPPSAASPAPSANTEVNSQAWLTPSAPAISRSWVAARTRIPQRVRRNSEMQGEEHGGPERDQHQLVLGKPLAEDRDRAGKSRRPRPEQVLGPPDHDHQLAHDQHDAEGREQLEQLRRRVDPPQQQDLDQSAEPADDQGGEQDCEPEAERRGAAAEPAGQAHGEIGAQHVERAVGEVDDPGDAENDREAGCDQEQRGGGGEAVQQLDDQEVQGRLTRAGCAARLQSAGQGSALA